MKTLSDLWIDHGYMHLEASEDVLFFMTYGFAILVLSLLADRKNRNPLAWGLIGGLFFPCSFICLLLESHLCPECRGPLTQDQWRLRRCPTCGTLAGRIKHDCSLIPAHEGTV
jgi:hypothetical protein